MKLLIYSGMLLIGIVIGSSMVRPIDEYFNRTARWGPPESGLSRKPARAPEAMSVRIARMISSESKAMDESLPLNKAMDVLFAERKSPMRTRAFLKSRIQMMTLDQIRQALKNGEVQTRAEVEEATRRLAIDNPEATFNLLDSPDLRLYGMDNVYAYGDTVTQTWADSDAPAVMAWLQKLKRGGTQKDWSTRFSDYWAKIDPAAAVQHFSDLVYLRNMPDDGTMVFTDNTYADRLVKSWKQKDESGMREFIANLAEGHEREALEKALQKLDAPKK